MKKDKQVAVCLEHRFYQVDNNVYTKLAFPYFYWQDYLDFFDHVTVVARVKKVSEVDEDMVLVNGPGVDVYPLPYYLGVKEFVFTFPSLTRSLFKVSSQHSHFLLRSGNSTNILFFILLLRKKPFIREYPGNIKQGIIGFAGDSLKVRLLANTLDGLARFQAKYSRANSFVSQYCCDLYSSNKPSFIFSSFKSSEIKAEKTNYKINGNVKVVSVGRLEGEKGHIQLLKAVEHLEDITIHLIGDGSQSATLKKFANDKGVDVTFHGAITDRERMFHLMKNSDIFVIPSFTEGMPRALLEAMTIGLPCLGSNVGGIPEVLQYDDLYEANSSDQLFNKLQEVISNEGRRKTMGERNKNFIENHFSDQALSQKKHRFWGKLYE